MNKTVPAPQVINDVETPIIIRALTRQLDSCDAIFENLSQEQYGRKIPFQARPEKLKSSVGEHLRHVLEFIDNVVCTPGDREVLDYDKRERNGKIQTDIIYAQETTVRLKSQLSDISIERLTSELGILEAVDVDHDDLPQKSSLGRELLFAVSHTEHHFYTILERCDEMGIALPDDFGVATSTLRHLKQHQI
ncbi:MAG: DinB family protein [Pseudomonadota bacterium]